MMRTTLALAATLFTAAAPAQAATIWALDAAGALAKIDTETRKAMPAKPVKGTDGALLAIALRPADGNFNPVVDRLRVVSSNGGNWRIHPDTGAVTVDGGLKYAPDSAYSEAKPMVTTGAYSNHFAGTKETALYTIDSKLGLMNVQMPPNDGIQQPRGRLNQAVPANAGFDILADGMGGNTGFVVAAGTLHGIDIKTGQITAIGRIAGLPAKEIVSIAVAK
jgi:hypothetical protein